MAPRHMGLLAGGIAILGGLIYVFLEVRSSPAAAVSDGDSAARGIPNKSTTGARKDPTTIARAPTPPPPIKTDVVEPPRDTPSPAIDPEAPPALPTDDKTFELNAAMDEANHHYDRGDYEAASKQALRVIANDPTNVRMLRVVVSSACLMGDPDTANQYQTKLPPTDQRDMARRCEKFGIALPTSQPATVPRVPSGVAPLVKKQ